jgi:acetate---CoA ligase (ADP-forming)
MDASLTSEVSLDRLFCPRGLAVVGSTGEGKIGYELVKQIVDGGYEQVVAVNPKAMGACGVPGYAAITDVDGPVDVAVIAAPAATVPDVLEDCGAAGVHTAVIISAGFSEVGNVAGENEIKAVASRHGIRMVGPNCAGIVNTHYHLYASLETRPPAGAVSFVSQSGAIGGAVLSWAEEMGMGFAKFLSYGNRADLDEIELLPYLAEDPDTEALALYIESVPDGRKFLEAVRTFTRLKPAIVIKSGRSQAGRRATLSHTGSLAGADAVYDAALKEAGAIRVESVEEMFDLCKGFVSLPPVRGRRIAIVTNSGGPGVLAADRAEEVGLSTPEPSPALRKRLASRLAPYCALGNPIDLTVEATEATYHDTLCAVLEEFDTALALDVSTPYLDSVALARGVCDAIRDTGKPIVVNFMAGRIVADAVAYLKEQGVPNYPTGERAVTVLARMADYGEWSRQSQAEAAGEESASEPVLRVVALPDSNPVLEPEAMAWLRDCGLPTPEFRWAENVERAVEACWDIGYPVVMKVVSPKILHKSEVGGVKVDIRDEGSARTAFSEIRAGAGESESRGVVVYPFITGAHEVLLGVSRDPQFGPVVAVGLGGIYTEVLHDVALRIAPVDDAQAHAMIRELRAYPILKGIRGQAGCDLDALAEALVTVSRLPFRYPEVDAVDLNPVFARPQGLLVGDARVIRKGQEAS